jgi:hypothetical protein
MSILDYIKAVDEALEHRYCVSIAEAGIDAAELLTAQAEGWSPEQYVEWFGEKHDLTEKSQWDLAKAVAELAPQFCSMCEGPLMLLGSLGNLAHYRCRNCGLDFSRGV